MNCAFKQIIDNLEEVSNLYQHGQAEKMLICMQNSLDQIISDYSGSYLTVSLPFALMYNTCQYYKSRMDTFLKYLNKSDIYNSEFYYSDLRFEVVHLKALMKLMARELDYPSLSKLRGA